jgi:3-oxoadipate enol-lactonase
MVDLGQGPAVAIIPGIQGRWEWMRPAVRALGRRCRTVSFSLCGEPRSGLRIDRRLGFDSFVVQVDAALDEAGLASAALCGVSFGGLIALRYAALRPERVRALVLVSVPPPDWEPGPRVEGYLRTPWLRAPLFVAGAPRRLVPEIWSASDSMGEFARLAVGQAARVIAAPMSPSRSAERYLLSRRVDLLADCARVAAPTLVVTGEPGLDRVVPAEQTRRFVHLIPGARVAVLERTGHLGLVTRPAAFADIVGGFVAAHEARPATAGRELAASARRPVA